MGHRRGAMKIKLSELKHVIREEIESQRKDDWDYDVRARSEDQQDKARLCRAFNDALIGFEQNITNALQSGLTPNEILELVQDKVNQLSPQEIEPGDDGDRGNENRDDKEG